MVGVNVWVPLVYFLQSNSRAEVAVLSAKRILRGNVRTDGSLNNEKISHTLFQYLNTPLRSTITSHLLS
ncbi:hypothetical protein E2C01_059808 [Portunus trituberculatus]|uniref:Uncharacterized protein n=1 Tax=Portunus trituberculatus TaxID=210409 RepID=A0A5B7H0J8_PORTR|nr:hypothetical protein [Portunus trituberculatus]